LAGTGNSGFTAEKTEAEENTAGKPDRLKVNTGQRPDSEIMRTEIRGGLDGAELEGLVGVEVESHIESSSRHHFCGK
jgi:hypothetical protein